jgi:hypothetical protein
MNLPISFLAPLSALIAAAVVPPLVLLYFLKLKRREAPVSSTLLWKRAVQDLQVNSPFQRLRNNLLLILQLLLLALVLLALTEPIWKNVEARDNRLVLVVDRSASMQTIEAAGRTRLELAKEAARQIVEDMGAHDEIMVIAFADRASVVCSFTNDKGLLERRIDAIEPTDGTSRLQDAMTLAEAHSTPVGEDIGITTNPWAPAHLVLISDGRVADASEMVLRRATMEYIRVGEATDNVGVVSMDVRRNHEQPEIVNIVARVRNLGTTPAQRDVSVSIDGVVKSVRGTGELAPNVVEHPKGVGGETEFLSDLPPEGSEVVTSFEIPHPTAGRIELSLSGSDALPADDRAFGTVEAPRPVSTLLVTPGNYFLKLALASLPGKPPDIVSPEQYEKMPDDQLLEAGRLKYDLVVFDAHSTDRLPPGNYMFFGGIPEIPDVKITGRVENELIVDWDSTHPVLRHVEVELIHVFAWNRLELPEEAEVLIQSVSGPVMAYLARDRRQYLINAFSVFDDERAHLNTNWVMTTGFPAFMYNAQQFLAGTVQAGGNRSIAPSEAIAIPAAPDASRVVVRRPDGETVTVPVGDDRVAYYADTTRAGLYVPERGAAGEPVFAVNLFSDAESDIRPVAEFHVGGEKVASTSGTQRLDRPLWPLLVLAAAVVLFVEWFVYNKRMYV